MCLPDDAAREADTELRIARLAQLLRHISSRNANNICSSELLGIVFHRVLLALAWEIDQDAGGFRYCQASNVLELLRLFYTVGIPPMLTTFLKSFERFPLSAFEQKFLPQPIEAT